MSHGKHIACNIEVVSFNARSRDSGNNRPYSAEPVFEVTAAPEMIPLIPVSRLRLQEIAYNDARVSRRLMKQTKDPEFQQQYKSPDTKLSPGK